MGKYKGSYSKSPADIFDLKGLNVNGVEAKRYLSTLVQASSGDQKFAWIDRDENERTFMIMNQIRRMIETFIGDGTTHENDGFKVSPITSTDVNTYGSSKDNNFKIKGPGASSMENAGRYYLKGLPATLLDDAEFIPPANSPNRIDSAKNIAPKITGIESSNTAENDVLVDNSATFPTSGNDLSGQKVVPDLDNPDTRYEIISNTDNSLKLDVSSDPDLLDATDVGKHYRVVPSDPTSDRVDYVYLDLYLDEVGPDEDDTILHEVQRDLNNDDFATEIEGQRRIKLVQNIILREDEQTLTDDTVEGNQHLRTKLAEIQREDGVAEIKSGLVQDNRNIIRKLSNIGFVNLVSNSSFELLNDNNNLLDWTLSEINNGSGTLGRNQSEAVLGNRSAELTANQLPDSDDRVRMVQILGDEPGEEDLEETFRGQSVTVIAQVKTNEGNQARLMAKESLTSEPDPSPAYSSYHSGSGNYEKLELNHLFPDKSLSEIQFGVEIANTTGTVYIDQFIVVFGEFTESVDYLTNVLADEISLVRDEVQQARTSDVYGEHPELDSRIESAEQEVVNARDSDTYGSHSNLDERIENLEDTFLTGHEQNGVHDAGTRTSDYITALKWSIQNEQNDGQVDRAVNNFKIKITDSDLIVGSTSNFNSNNPDHFQKQLSTIGCGFGTIFGMKLEGKAEDQLSFKARLVDNRGSQRTVWGEIDPRLSNPVDTTKICVGDTHPRTGETMGSGFEMDLAFEVEILNSNTPDAGFCLFKVERTEPAVTFTS